ncbi:VOC family protein [Ekhidna sp.]|uniref:VOC family protein n=1 Tax=Ekhidna sp. TaxID=2608089 RepID=UPI003B510675
MEAPWFIFTGMRNTVLTLCLLAFSISCSTKENATLIAFNTYCEMVANDAKPIALSEPISTEEMDERWDAFEEIAEKWNVSIYRETNFPVTQLFSAKVTVGKEVVAIYREPRLKQYEQLKTDLDKIEPMEAARRFGRLLGYSPQGINELLMKNTDFRTLDSFGVERQITHLYYENAEEAKRFYREVLGLKTTDSNRFIISEEAQLQINAFDDEHTSDQAKSTAIAFLTDQLPLWYDHVQAQEVPIKYTYKPREGGPHDGFVAIDPGGYLLEFEEFKQHPENELFMAYLEKAPRITTSIEDLNFYGSITWTYHHDLLKMQKFYEEVLGFQLVADQGWTKIYRTSPTGFIGLVDERRGMMDYADQKAVEIEWSLSDRKSSHVYFQQTSVWNGEKKALMGPEKYLYLLR